MTTPVTILEVNALRLMAERFGEQEAATWSDYAVPTRIALCHSELSEALEADRKGLMSEHIEGFTGVEEELADVLIRVLGWASRQGLRVPEAVAAKHAYNRLRADHKAESRSAPGGKRY